MLANVYEDRGGLKSLTLSREISNLFWGRGTWDFIVTKETESLDHCTCVTSADFVKIFFRFFPADKFYVNILGCAPTKKLAKNRNRKPFRTDR